MPEDAVLVLQINHRSYSSLVHENITTDWNCGCYSPRTRRQSVGLVDCRLNTTVTCNGRRCAVQYTECSTGRQNAFLSCIRISQILYQCVQIVRFSRIWQCTRINIDFSLALYGKNFTTLLLVTQQCRNKNQYIGHLYKVLVLGLYLLKSRLLPR